MHQLRDKPYQFDEEEIALFDYLWVLWKRKFLILLIVAIGVSATYVIKVYCFRPPPDIYQAKAIIKPKPGFQEDGGSSSQGGGSFGSLARMVGMPLAGESKESGDLVIWFESNTLKEKVIKEYNLLPVLFADRWDGARNQWKMQGGDATNPQPNTVPLIQKIKNRFIKAVNQEYYHHTQPMPEKNSDKPPTLWDGVKLLERVMKVEQGEVGGTLTVMAEYKDPEIAAKLVEYFLETLNEHLSEEARESAEINKRFLERQLDKTKDPIVQQKISNLIAQEIEKQMMSDVKENFGFQVIDPPRIPDEKLVKEEEDKMLILSLVLSLMLALFLSFFFRVRSKTEESS